MKMLKLCLIILIISFNGHESIDWRKYIKETKLYAQLNEIYSLQGFGFEWQSNRKNRRHFKAVQSRRANIRKQPNCRY